MKLIKGLTSALLTVLLLFTAQSAGAQTATRWAGNEYTSLATNAAVPDDDHVVYLYNVKEGMFAIQGGYWGTHVMLFYQDYGIPMQLMTTTAGTYSLKTTVNSSAGGFGQGTNLGIAISSNKDDAGWYVDRGDNTALSFERTDDETTYTYFISTRNGNSTYYLSSEDSASVMTTTKPGVEGQWRLVTKNQLKAVLSAEEADAFSGLNADVTYLIDGNEFTRNEANVFYVNDATPYKWKTENTGTDDSYYCYAWSDATYLTSEPWNRFGYRVEAGDRNGPNANRPNGPYYNCSLEGVGTMSQVITVPKSGWYKLTCQGFFAGDASRPSYLFANVSGGQERRVALKDATADFPIVESSTVAVLNPNGTRSGTRTVRYLRNADNGLTAGKKFVAEAYPNEIWFYVGSDNTDVTIGIEKPYAQISGSVDEGTYDLQNGSNYYFHDTDYTAVDNFQLKYIGEPPFIFDETEESTDYMDRNLSNRTILLRRSFTLGSWNSLVLPVDLTSAQVKQAFGNNVELARLEGLDEKDNMIIKFTNVELPADGNAITAGNLYIIKPTKAAASTTFELDGRTYSGAYYTLGRRNFNGEEVVAAGTEIIECKRTQASHPNDIAAYGTYVKLDKAKGTACPAGSYVFSGGKMYHTVSNLSIKGFRGWIVDTNKNASAKSFRVSADDGSNVTAIDGVETAAEKEYDGRIFDMSGRTVRTDGSIKELPSGIYIVNHRKVVKK